MFMRASEPSPSTSWVCTIATLGARGERERDQPPVRVRRRRPIWASTSRAAVVRQRAVPAQQRVVVVGAGVDDLVLAMVREVVRRVRVRVEVVLQDRHAREAEAVAQALHRRGDDAEVLRDQGQLAELRGRRVEHRAPGAALPVPGQRVAGARGHRPVGDEAAEVVDAGEVVEVEGAPQALDPPAVAAPLQRRPVVERVAPQLALVGERVGRRARDGAGLEELRVGACGRRCRARRRSGRRRSASRRGRARSGAARPTRGRSGPGRRALRGRRWAIQSSIQRALRSRKSSSSRLRHRRARLRRAARATPRTPTWPCRASRSGRAGRAAASATTTGPRRAASRRTRRLPRPVAPRGGRSDAVARRWNERVSSGVQVGYSGAGMPAAKRTQAPPRIRIRPLSPVIDAGRYAPKRCVGDAVTVAADVFSDGHEKLRAVIRYRAPGGRNWLEAEMHADRRPPQRRPLGGELPGRDPGLLGVLGRGLDRPLRHLARRDPAQGRRRAGGPLRRAVRGRRAARAREAQGRAATSARSPTP